MAMLVASASNYLLNLALARLLDQRSFGDASLMVTSMLALTSIAVAFQLVTVSSVAGADPGSIGRRRSRMLRSALSIGTAIAVVLWLAADVLQDQLQTGSAWPFRVLGLGIPFYLAQAVDRGVVQARLSFGRLAVSYLAEAGVRVGAGLGLVIAGFGVVGTTWGLSLSFVASWLVVAPRGRAIRTVGRDVALERAAFAPMALLLGAQVIINNGDVLLSKLVFAPEDAGLYAAVALVGRAVFFVSWAAVQVVFPAVAAGDDASQSLVDRAIVGLLAFGALSTLAATLLADTIASLLFGAEYQDAGALLGPYAAATSMFSVVNLIVTSDIGRGTLRSGWMMLAGAVAQTAVLAVFANSSSQMVWLQVMVMAVMTLGIGLDRLRPHLRRVPTFTAAQFRFATADGTRALD